METLSAQKISPGSSAVAATSRGVAVASAVAAHAKGAWVVVDAGIYYGKAVILTLESEETGTDFLVDVAIGSAGQEVVVFADILFSSMVAAGSGRAAQLVIPMPFSNGAVNVRCQSSAGSKTVYATAHYVGTHNYLYGISNTYGANVADTGGVSIDPGGTAHTKGAYSEIVAAASMTRAAKGFYLCFGGQLNAAMTTASWLVDIAIGGAGSEIVLLPNIPLHVYGATSLVTPGNTVFFPMPIPSGTRIAARAQCSINDATDRLVDVIMYTVS